MADKSKMYKTYGETFPNEDTEYEKKPDRTIDDREFEHVDHRKERAMIVLDALPKYKKKHYDEGGTYDFTDKDPETGHRELWRLKKPEKPTS